ncbi:hypothetical protein BGZ76_008443 [Entomortierella beljakovae]|nr:hypothetical protein BGZ76_008443 [Entomortierella beljakovae]
MKVSLVCIISLGLSLVVLGDAAKHNSHGDNHNKHVEKHHNNEHPNKQHANHANHANHDNKKNENKHKKVKGNNDHKQHQNYHEVKQHHHHMAPKVIPSVPYAQGSNYKAPENNAPVVPEQNYVPQVPQIQDPSPASNNNNNVPEAHQQTPWSVPQKNDKMVVAYWTDWTSSAMPPEAIPFEKITHLNYAFSVVTPDFRPVFDTDFLLSRVTRAAHANNVKVLMSIGGWTGSQYFSPLAASQSGRKTFVDGAVRMVQNYNLDGIDIDWEYPGRLGSACNIFDEANDAKNFLTLLRELRAALSQLPNGQNLEISLATRIVPFDGPNGQLQDVSEFSKVVNHINIMAYDINGSWGDLTGANAPLTGAGDFNYEGGAEAWINAGFPPQQINMGVPFYGRSLITKADMTSAISMVAPFHKKVPIGDSNDGLWTDPCEKAAAYSGVWKYKNMRDQGLLDANGNAKGPWIKKFDKESQTPWLFNPHTKQFISYDDRESLGLKVDFAKRKGLGGMMLWALNQDSSNFELLDVLQGIRQ